MVGAVAQDYTAPAPVLQSHQDSMARDLETAVLSRACCLHILDSGPSGAVESSIARSHDGSYLGWQQVLVSGCYYQ